MHRCLGALKSRYLTMQERQEYSIMSLDQTVSATGCVAVVFEQNIEYLLIVCRVLYDKRIKSFLSRFDSGAYSRMQFLLAVSHSVGAHTESLTASLRQQKQQRGWGQSGACTNSDNVSGVRIWSGCRCSNPDDCCEVCLVAPREDFALVSCGHARFSETCVRRVADQAAGCFVCHKSISMIMRTVYIHRRL